MRLQHGLFLKAKTSKSFPVTHSPICSRPPKPILRFMASWPSKTLWWEVFCRTILCWKNRGWWLSANTNCAFSINWWHCPDKPSTTCLKCDHIPWLWLNAKNSLNHTPKLSWLNTKIPLWVPKKFMTTTRKALAQLPASWLPNCTTWKSLPRASKPTSTTTRDFWLWAIMPNLR